MKYDVCVCLRGCDGYIIVISKRIWEEGPYDA